MINKGQNSSNLQNIIKELEKENQKLKKALENEKKMNKEEIEKLENHIKSFVMKSNISLIDQNQNCLLNKNVNFMNFYDVIIDIKSIKDITKGWEVKMSEKAQNEYKNFKNSKIIKIGVIGNSNKGKSFILSKISKIILPSGTSVRTEGLSIKYPELSEYKNRKMALLDSCGLEAPVLIEDNLNEQDIKEKKEDKKEEDNKEETKEEKKEEKEEEQLKLEKEELNEQKDKIKQNEKIEIKEKVKINDKKR